jgi:hypothetical protein
MITKKKIPLVNLMYMTLFELKILAKEVEVSEENS